MNLEIYIFIAKQIINTKGAILEKYYDHKRFTFINCSPKNIVNNTI